jgi:hypothetical protein
MPKVKRAAEKPDVMRVEKNAPNVITIRFDDVSAGWEHWFLLSSDRHHDSISCNRELEIEHLEQLKQKGGHCLDFGDIFDVMQGKYDPRRSYSEMRPEYLKAMNKEKMGYLDVVVKDLAQFYAPYAERILLISKGNHETAIASHNDTDLIERLVSRMNIENKANIHKGAYGGWVRFMFTIGKTRHESIKLKYFHGSGGGGPVTKGTIQSNRQAVYLPDADIVVNGHIHESWILTLKRERISDKGMIYQDAQFHVRTATYKDDYGDGSGNWHVERGAPPKPMGAVWMRLYYDNEHIRTQLIQDVR